MTLAERLARLDAYRQIRELAARSDDFALEVLNAVEHSQAQALAQVPSEVRR